MGKKFEHSNKYAMPRDLRNVGNSHLAKLPAQSLAQNFTNIQSNDQ